MLYTMFSSFLVQIGIPEYVPRSTILLRIQIPAISQQRASIRGAAILCKSEERSWTRLLRERKLSATGKRTSRVLRDNELPRKDCESSSYPGKLWTPSHVSRVHVLNKGFSGRLLLGPYTSWSSSVSSSSTNQLEYTFKKKNNCSYIMMISYSLWCIRFHI
jgi:hypothetical protein